jgi:hypothetical protein
MKENVHLIKSFFFCILQMDKIIVIKPKNETLMQVASAIKNLNLNSAEYRVDKINKLSSHSEPLSSNKKVDQRRNRLKKLSITSVKDPTCQCSSKPDEHFNELECNQLIDELVKLMKPKIDRDKEPIQKIPQVQNGSKRVQNFKGILSNRNINTSYRCLKSPNPNLKKPNQNRKIDKCLYCTKQSNLNVPPSDTYYQNRMEARITPEKETHRNTKKEIRYPNLRSRNMLIKENHFNPPQLANTTKYHSAPCLTGYNFFPQQPYTYLNQSVQVPFINDPRWVRFNVLKRSVTPNF